MSQPWQCGTAHANDRSEVDKFIPGVRTVAMKDNESRAQIATLDTFQHLFPTEAECIAFLFALRWPGGFVCPFCASRHPHLSLQRYLLCPHCGNRSSLTTGTLLHGTKKPMREWLLAIWWFSLSSFDASAKELQRLLELSCYQTAWTWLQKLRLAMAEADQERCQGVVELGCDSITPAKERRERALVLTVVEIVLAHGITGRIRMRHIGELNEQTLGRFLQEAVRATSTLLIGEQRLISMIAPTSTYTIVPSDQDISSRIQGLNRSFENCLHWVHRGGVTTRHLQQYLDEFCFRNNAGLLPDHKAVFNALVKGVLSGSIKQYQRTLHTAAADLSTEALP